MRLLNFGALPTLEAHLPALWLGLVQRGEQLSPWWVRDWHLRYRASPAKCIPYDLKRREPGQFLLGAGGDVQLAGVVLPIQTCIDPLARAQLEALAKADGRRPATVREGFQRIGPFGRDRDAERWAVEGFVALDCSGPLYRWLRLRFQMAVALEYSSWPRRCRLMETAPLPGEDIAAFARWLGGEAPILPTQAIQRFLSVGLVPSPP
jgi:hypothetical protein